MRRFLAVAVIGVTTGCGAHSGSLQVHPDGRIGPLQIDVSTEAQIRAFAGRPFKVEMDFSGDGRRRTGRSLSYRCGRGCVTTYSVSRATGRLSDYWTQSPRFTTEHGSHVGMAAVKAARLERKKPRPGCGFPRYIYLRTEKNLLFVLAIWKEKVDSIGYLGTHTVYYEGLC